VNHFRSTPSSHTNSVTALYLHLLHNESYCWLGYFVNACAIITQPPVAGRHLSLVLRESNPSLLGQLILQFTPDGGPSSLLLRVEVPLLCLKPLLCRSQNVRITQDLLLPGRCRLGKHHCEHCLDRSGDGLIVYFSQYTRPHCGCL
jgi:hypothetical protein